MNIIKAKYEKGKISAPGELKKQKKKKKKSFSATSMGADENGLDNTSGGLCSTHSMKLKLFVHPGGKINNFLICKVI